LNWIEFRLVADNELRKSFRELSASRFILIVTAVNLLLYHIPLFRYAKSHLETVSVNTVLTLATLLTVACLITILLLSIVGFITPFLLKPLVMLLALCNGFAIYFLIKYNVIFDRDMMGNVFNTRSEESLEFFHPKLILYFIGFGVLPAWLISKLRIVTVNRVRILVQAVLTLTFAVVFIYVNSSTWLWFDKHSKQLGGLIVPWSYLINTGRHFANENKGQKEVALLPAASMLDDKKMLVVLVIGETARSQNFSLYGYERDTNPRLSQLDISVVPDAKSCSTYTKASLHCMLSHTGKKSGSFEILPNYLQRHGVDVIWRSNNWGEPPLSVGVFEKAAALRDSCSGEFCESDDALLVDLAERIDAATSKKTFLVLHMKGSHGPAYHTRYPDKFNVFKPVCESVELDQCSEQSLINAYDNTILYTDDFLSRAIELLSGFDQLPVAFMYASDHGESLGEYGLYLHGTPYSVAPDVQKQIPFIVWMSEAFRQEKGISTEDITMTNGDTAHSYIFHSVLGAFDVQSKVYKPEFDLFHQP